MERPYFPNQKTLDDLGHALVAAGFKDRTIRRLIGNIHILRLARCQLEDPSAGSQGSSHNESGPIHKGYSIL